MALRIGLVGAGVMMEAVHIPALKRLAGVDIAGIADIDTSLAERVARDSGIPCVYESAEALIAALPLDGLVVATRKETHAVACLPALQRGIPVLVEKPLEASIPAAKELVRAARTSGAPLMVGYMKRCDPAVTTAERIVRSGKIGRLRYGAFHDFGGDWTAGYARPHTGPIESKEESIEKGSGKSPAEDPEKSVPDPFLEWIEVWIHDVNLARAFFGRPVEVLFATRDEIKVAVVQYERGRVRFEVGMLNKPGNYWDEEFSLYGDAGHVKAHFPPPLLLRAKTELAVHGRDGIMRPNCPPLEAFFEQDRAFVRMIVDQGRPVVGGEEALDDLLLCRELSG